MVVVPSNSPENAPRWIKEKGNLFAGITMDNQLVFDLFSNTCEAAKVLGEDVLFCDTLISMRRQLPLCKWDNMGSFRNGLKIGIIRRTITVIFPTYGGCIRYQISPYRSPILFEAARNTLIQRGDPSTGWSMGWKVCFWARMLDGDHAYKLIKIN